MTPQGKVYFTEEEELARDAEEAEWAAEADNRLAAKERAKRNALLMETDHYALADVTMSDAMKTYRQALRDVPQQTDFPGTINWPTKP
jgi:delta 1-pyrroline-5-carboxylate dehydrogenase